MWRRLARYLEIEDHGQDQSFVNSEVPRRLPSYSAFWTPPRPSQKLATEELGVSTFISSIEWRYIVLGDHRSRFSVSNFRMKHLSCADARSQIHQSQLTNPTPFPWSAAHRVIPRVGAFTCRYCDSDYRESNGTLLAGQYNGTFSIDSGAAFKTAHSPNSRMMKCPRKGP
jgi:hypothetical protein